MLIGSYYHRLQTKGRLAIPVAFRHALGEQPILTRGLEPHLNLLPFNTWSNLVSELGTHPLVDKNKRRLRRLLAHNAHQVDFDAQGRILLPQALIDWGKLSQRIVIAGSIHWVEIWDQNLYNQELDTINSDEELINKAFSNE